MPTTDQARNDGSYQGRTVVVTGAGGFIGSHLVERLVREGAHVRAFLRYNSRGDPGHLKELSPDVRAAVEIVAGDLRDARRVAETVRGADYVFHLAALIGIPYSYVTPDDVVATNILGTLNALNAARDAGVQRMVHTSSSEVYGTARYAPIDEAHPLQGQSPYSATKIGADKLVESFHLSFGLPVTTVRPFNCYGPRQSARAVIPATIVQALTGDVIRLGSLEPKRDFTFVRDTVDGFVRCALAPRCLGEVVNIGSGVEVSVGDIVQQIRSIVGRNLPVETDEARVRPPHSEVLRLLCSRRKAAELAGWEPRVPMAQGLRETVEWIADHIEDYPVRAYAI